MARPSQNFTATVYHAPAFDAVQAVGVVTAAVAGFVVVGVALAPGLDSLVAAQLVGLAAVPIGVALVRRRSLATLGLGRPGLRALAGAALVGATFWYANLQLWAPLVVHLDRGELPALEQRLLGDGALGLRLVAVALVPALCEELTMRGVLARSLAPLGSAFAIAVSAIAFAAFHMSAVRFGPTLAFGLVLGFITLRSGTIWPAVLAHALNNATALLVATGALTLPLAGSPAALVTLAIVATGAGIALAAHPSAS